MREVRPRVLTAPDWEIIKRRSFKQWLIMFLFKPDVLEIGGCFTEATVEKLHPVYLTGPGGQKWWKKPNA